MIVLLGYFLCVILSDEDCLYGSLLQELEDSKTSVRRLDEIVVKQIEDNFDKLNFQH